MAQPRLTTALADGGLTLPAGRVVVMRPPAGYDLSALAERPTIQHGFRPDWDYWAATGHEMVEEVPEAATALVVVPRSKALARGMIATAAQRAQLVVVDGQRSEGVDSLWRDVRKILGEVPVIAKAHGRLMWFPGGDAFDTWANPGPLEGPEGYLTQPGVFSEGDVDRGSRLLVASLPARLPARVADLGAGWGYIAAEVLARHPEIAELSLIEAEALALDCARRNVTDPRARFHWADATRATGTYDAILTNPPFHASRAADPGLGTAFIAAAARLLTPQGHLWLVANRHLPYEAALRERFAVVEEAGGDPAFKVFHAARPRR